MVHSNFTFILCIAIPDSGLHMYTPGPRVNGYHIYCNYGTEINKWGVGYQELTKLFERPTYIGGVEIETIQTGIIVQDCPRLVLLSRCWLHLYTLSLLS